MFQGLHVHVFHIQSSLLVEAIGLFDLRATAPFNGSATLSRSLVVSFWWFGFAHYAADPADHPMVGKLGPNALDLSLDQFRALLRGRRGAIKTFLLDQDRIAGIGNVYVQTPLRKAKIHTLRPIPSLSGKEIAALWQALREILQGSIDAGGAPFELNLYGQKGGWDDSYLFHWEEGAPCLVCGTPLAKIRTGSTGSYICPGCQGP